MGKRAAKVISVGALADFKAALAKFGEQAKVALIEANSDMQRTVNRLQGEVMSHWQHEVKLWTRKVAEAKSELHRAQLQSNDERPSAILERKALDAAQHRLKTAQEKIERTRHWLRALEREMMLCKGQLQQLDRAIDADLPRVAAQVDRMMESLDQYMRVQREGPAVGVDAEQSVREGSSAIGGALQDEPAEMQADAPHEEDGEGDERDEKETSKGR